MVQKPPFAGIDLDLSRRPGYQRNRPPAPWPNARVPPSRQQGTPSAPRHGRPGKPMPPVFSTAVPLRGLAGALRRQAYAYPDHLVRHWLVLLFADRVDSWAHHGKKLAALALPLAALALAGRRIARRSGRPGRGRAAVPRVARRPAWAQLH